MQADPGARPAWRVMQGLSALRILTKLPIERVNFS
jgi:hypothetical protein